MLKSIKDYLSFINPFNRNLPEKPLVVVIASYDNALWYEKNLSSVFQQKYNNYRVVYIDDCSDDGTGILVEQYVKLHNQENRFTLVKNAYRQGASANRYMGSHLCNDEEIVLILDGDDWLANDQVFKLINRVYSTQDVWLTYGQFRRWPSGIKGQCKRLPQNFNFRTMDKWYTSALRTYYAWLFKRVKKEDLFDNGDFFRVAGDVAEMLPMLEMARGHIKFISKVLYIYNVQTPCNDFKLYLRKQKDNTRVIQQRKPYQQIEL